MASHEITVLCFGACLATLVFIRIAPAKVGWCRDLAVMILAATTVFYAWQRLCLLPPFVPRSAQSYWQWSFVFTEAVALIYELWVCAVLRRMTDHSRAADLAEAAFRGQTVSSLPRIAVFLTTFREPPGIVQLSLKAARALRDGYQGELTVYCLDDGLFKIGADGRPFSDAASEKRSRKLRRACAKYGAVYLANPDKRRAKAGNLQFAFERTTEEILVVLDADFHADPQRFLPRTVGLLLQNPEVGLVQVPQCFINPDPIALNLCVPQAICDSQSAFMRVVEPCRDRFGNAFCVGSGWVVRRNALDAIGGFRNLTTYAEDLETTYRLKLAGYETRFLNETLAFGLAPESLPEFLGQQARWCLGCLQQLPLRSGPIRGRHTLLDRLFYLDPPVFWLTHLATIQILLAPILFWYFAVVTIPDADHMLLNALVFRLSTRSLLMFWLTLGISIPVLSSLPKVLSAFHICLAILKWAFINPRRPYRVSTEKGQSRRRAVVRWPLFLFFASLSMLTFGGMLLGPIGTDSHLATHAAAPLNYVWSITAAVISFLAALVCIELPTPRIDYLSRKTVEKVHVWQTLRGVFRRVVNPDNSQNWHDEHPNLSLNLPPNLPAPKQS